MIKSILASLLSLVITVPAMAMEDSTTDSITQSSVTFTKAKMNSRRLPVGSVISVAATELHEKEQYGWLKCDGKLVSKREYPNLFKVIGYQYGGSGDHFNLPDYRGKYLRGYKKKVTNVLGTTQEAMAVGSMNGSVRILEKPGMANHVSSNVKVNRVGSTQQVKVQKVTTVGKIFSLGTKKNKKYHYGSTYSLSLPNENYGVDDGTDDKVRPDSMPIVYFIKALGSLPDWCVAGYGGPSTDVADNPDSHGPGDPGNVDEDSEGEYETDDDDEEMTKSDTLDEIRGCRDEIGTLNSDGTKHYTAEERKQVQFLNELLDAVNGAADNQDAIEQAALDKYLEWIDKPLPDGNFIWESFKPGSEFNETFGKTPDLMITEHFLKEAKSQKLAAEQGRGNCPWDSHASMESDRMRKYADAHNMQVGYLDRGDLAHNSSEWNQVINGLQNRVNDLKNTIVY